MLYGAQNPQWKGGRIVDRCGYIRVLMPEHSNAMANGYILEHRLVMSNFLGRPLRDGEIVHHQNGCRKDNRIENLLLTSRSEHISLHYRGVLRSERIDIICLCCGKSFRAKIGTPRRAMRKYCTQQCSNDHKRGRYRIPENLSMADAEQIRSASGSTERQLASRFGVSRHCIGRILRREIFG